MSMLSSQADELRLMARLVRDYDYKEISRMLREAADTIENLRKQVAKCQIAELKTDYDTSRYFELFGTSERAARTLAQTFNTCTNSRKQCRGCPFRNASVCPNVNSETDLLRWLEGDAE